MEAVKNCPKPFIPTDIRSFLGLIYRRFMDGFVSIASPLTTFTQKLLILPEGTKGFVVYCDASRVVLGCVLCNMELNLRELKWFELLKDYDMSFLYHPGKANVVADAQRRMNIGSVSQIDKAKKYLVKDVNRLARLGVRLEDSPNGGFMVHHNSESSLVVEVKSKQHLHKSLMELKESVLGKLNEACSLEGTVF
ncbi:hypothetical protein EJD97_000964 [Solanum chilense]|uniref:Reverse transcriptase/retrotransposon-derived protein RNase H-like domain-containing protein n=1 Tax=Solanum chilense TaxID=4083 RepID=A0A6N2C3U9_SOLCI|nr:hypothetical protein EJD97_000964 [Solanum chilense]